MRVIFIIFTLIELIPLVVNEDNCVKDDNCSYLSICKNNHCVHKSFNPPHTSEIVGTVSIVLGSAVSNAGGIGGGGLLIPILILILKFSTHEAIPISKLMIFTGALTAFLMGLKNKHPHHKHGIPLDFNLAGLLTPMLLFGTVVGVSLNKVMPASIILISLTIVLVTNTFKTTTKKENDEIKRLNSANKEESQSLTVEYAKDNNSCNRLNYDSVGEEKATMNDSVSVASITEELENAKLSSLMLELEKDKIYFPLDKVYLITIAFVTLIAVSLLKGSDHFESLIKIRPCSSCYWVLYFLYLPIAVFITYYYAAKIMAQYKFRKSINYPFHESDVKWSNEIIIKYPLYALFGGSMAGLLGIGGGLIFGPLLLDLGLNPIVSTATSNFLVLFTSCSTSLQFILLGTMNFDYGLICTICSTLGSYLGTVVIQKLLERTGRTSILIFSMALVEGVSSICIPLHAYFEVRRDMSQGVDIWNFGSPC